MDASGKTTRRGATALQGIAAGLISGVLLVLAFPPTNWGWLAIFVPLAPAMFAMSIARRGCGLLLPALCVGAGALPAWLWLHRFMLAITGPGYPAHGLYMAVYPALYVWLLARCARRSQLGAWLIGVPVLWVGLEFLRGEIAIGGYPWCLLGHPAIDFMPAKKAATVFGVYGVSMLVALVIPLQSAARVLLDRGKGGVRVSSAIPLTVIGLFALLLGAGYALAPAEGTGSIKLRLVSIQTNLPQDNKMAWSVEKQFEDFERWRGMTIAAASTRPKPDLIIWPETMFPGAGLDAESLAAQEKNLRSQGSQGSTRTMVFADLLLRDQGQHQVPLMMGGVAFDGLRFESDASGKRREQYDGKFNSVLMLRNGRVEAERYDKMHLTPFGEEIPLLWRWPGLQQAVVGLGAKGMEFDLKRGAAPRYFEVAGRGADGKPASVKVVTPICYEATFSDTCRELAYKDGRPAANLLLNLSNDGWFGSQAGARETHMLVARWRCVELALPMFRCVNTGISAAIDREGKVLAAGVDGRTEHEWVEGVLTHEFLIDPNSKGTIFGKVGNVFGWAAFVGACGMSVWTFLPRRKRGEPVEPIRG